MATNEVNIVIGAKNTASKALKEVSKDVTTMSKKVQAGIVGVGKTAVGVTTKIAKWGAVVSAVGIGIGAKMATMASDAEETTNKMNEIFGESANMITNASQNAAQSIGASRQEFQAMTSDIGNLLIPMGFTEEAAAKMSIQMTKLAGDLGSFNNIPTAEALNKIRAGIVGESEPLRALGVQLSATRIKQEALNMGLISGKEELTSNIKAQVTMALVLKDTKKAQGDFARTSKGMANTQKTLSASWNDQIEILGKFFVPIATKVLIVLSEIMNKVFPVFENGLKNLSEWWNTNSEGVKVVVDKLKTDFLPIIIQTYDFIKSNVIILLKELEKWWKKNNEAIIKISSSFLKVMIPVWKAGYVVLQFFIKVVLETLGVILRFVAATIVAFENFWKFIVNFGKGISNTWNNLWNGLASVTSRATANIKLAALSMVNGVIESINRMLSVINAVASKVGIHISAIPTIDTSKIESQLAATISPTIEGPSLPASRRSRGGTVINNYVQVDGTITNEQIAGEVAEVWGNQLGMQSG